MKIRAFVLLSAIFLPGTIHADWQEMLDSTSLSKRARSIRRGLVPSSVAEYESFLAGFDLDKETSSIVLENIRPEACRNNAVPSLLRMKGITHERLVFPSAHPEDSAPAVFYLCAKPGPMKDRKTLLWVPGMGVSKFAFRFIRGFLEAALERDYLVVFYIPPLHMDRLSPGRKPGDGFFNGDPLHDIRRVLDCVRELRTASSWLRVQGIRSLSGWGGSMGAPMIVLLSQFERLDHLCLMIPVLDWVESWVKNPLFVSLLQDLGKIGYADRSLKLGYGLISPSNYALFLPPERVQLLIAAKDRLNPLESAHVYANKRKINSFHVYDRSHGTILIEKNMFRDYEAFLDGLKN